MISPHTDRFDDKPSTEDVYVHYEAARDVSPELMSAVLEALRVDDLPVIEL